MKHAVALNSVHCGSWVQVCSRTRTWTPAWPAWLPCWQTMHTPHAVQLPASPRSSTPTSLTTRRAHSQTPAHVSLANACVQFWMPRCDMFKARAAQRCMLWLSATEKEATAVPTACAGHVWELQGAPVPGEPAQPAACARGGGQRAHGDLCHDAGCASGMRGALFVLNAVLRAMLCFCQMRTHITRQASSRGS